MPVVSPDMGNAAPPPRPFQPPTAQIGPQGGTYYGAQGTPSFSQMLGSPQALFGGIQSYELDPALQAEQAQIGLLTGPGGQGQMTAQQLALQQQLTQQEAGFSLANLGVQGSNLDLQRQNLAAQQGPLGFASQQRVLTEAEQAQQNKMAQQGLRSSLTASGGINTQGAGNQWSNLLAQQGFEAQQNALSAREQAQAYQSGNAQLDNAAKTLGISRQEIDARLSNALAQYGLQGQMDANSIASAVQQIQAGFASGPMAQAIQQILQAAGLPLSSLLGGGTATTPGAGITSNPSRGTGL